MSRALVIALLLLAAAPGYSAVVIGLEHTGDSPFRTYSSATIFIDGAALRVDLQLLPDVTARFDRIVRSGRDGELIAINTRNEKAHFPDMVENPQRNIVRASGGREEHRGGRPPAFRTRLTAA